MDEWTDIKPSSTDASGDALNGGDDIESIYAAKDPQYLYLAAVVKGKDPSVNFKLDYNNDDKPEYGANYDPYRNTIYIFRFDEEDKSVLIDSIHSAASGNGIELKIPLSTIGNPGKLEVYAFTDTGEPDNKMSDDTNWFDADTYNDSLSPNTAAVGLDASKDNNNSSKSLSNNDGMTVKKGSYVYLGQYYDQPILWECVKKDKYGIMLVSKYIVCLKPFDAAEGGKYNGKGSTVKKFGSNVWKNSNIREWLNSDQNSVKYSTTPPVKEALFNGFNAYDKESGFLTNFTKGERNIIKPVKHDGVEDRVFLLSAKEIAQIWPKPSDRIKKVTSKAFDYSEFQYYEFKKGGNWVWITRTAAMTYGCHVNDIDFITGEITYMHACRGLSGIVPALYLKADTTKSGKGTMSSPYIIVD